MRSVSKDYIKNLDKEWIEDMFIYSFRYTLGRMSYSPGVYMDFMTPLIPYSSLRVLDLITREISEYPFDGLMDHKNDWLKFQARIDYEICRRKNEGT